MWAGTGGRGIAGEQLLDPGLRLSGQLIDRFHCIGELGAGHAALLQRSPDRRQATAAGVGRVEQDVDGVAQRAGGDVEGG